MHDNYKILQYRPQHNNQLRKLYIASYGRKRSIKYFRYRLNENPFGKPIAYVMTYNDVLVGFYAITPIRLNVNKKSILGGYSFLTMTHPKHIKKGIFQKLAKKTFEKAKQKKYNFIMGFANPTSFPIFTKKLGFIHLTPINHIEIKFNSKSLSMLPDDSKTPLNPNLLWKKYTSKDNLIFLDRSNGYLKWRYKNPEYDYYVISSQNGYFVYKKFEHTLHILDFFGMDNEQFYQNLFDNTKKLSKKLDCKKITLWISKKHKLMQSPELLIKKNKTNSFFIIKILNQKLHRKLSSIDNWYYTMSDADIF